MRSWVSTGQQAKCVSAFIYQEYLMTTRARTLVLVLAATLLAAMLPPSAANASREGRRNTAYALGALGLYGLATKKWWLAAAGLGGGVYLYTQADRHHHRRRYYYRPQRRGRYYYVPRYYRGERVEYYRRR